MFGKNYDQRLLAWSDFRNKLETSNDPIQDAIDFYNAAPTVSIHTDPWDKSTWPSPWELIQENQYCEFCRVLGLCYSLQLTERFSGDQFEIHIVIDSKNSATHYLLHVGNIVIGHPYGATTHAENLPSYYKIKKKYCMEKLQ